MKICFALAGLLLASPALASPASFNAADPRTAFVQLFEWPWNAVAEECERYLGPAGFAAVQVSPPQEHVKTGRNTWWERYQPVSHRLESRSGSEAEFTAMVKRCKAVGVDVYADVVLNHMSAAEEGIGFAGTPHRHYEYPGLFSYDDFHHCGRNHGNVADDIINYGNLYELQNCELLNLADLNTGKPSVQDKLAELLRRLLTLGTTGFRIDAAKHMASEDIAGIFARVGKPFYAVHELITGPGEPVPVGPYTQSGDVNVFPYAYGIGMAVRQGNISWLPELAHRFGVRSEEAVVFLENHDLERRPKEEPLVLFVGDEAQHRLGMVFLLTYPYGYPQLYSGYRFNDYDQGPPVDGAGRVQNPVGADGQCLAPWTCAHRAPGVAALVRFRNRTNGVFRATDLASPRPQLLSYGRGNLGHVVLNAGASSESAELRTQMAPGRYCNLLDAGHCAEVDGQGTLRVTLPARSSFVIQDRS